MQSVSEKLGNAVRSARQERQLTQRELAERLSISPHYLMTIENKEQIPGSDLLFRIIRELNLSADAIFYPEQGRDCELISKLRVLLDKFGENDIERVIAILQILLDTKCVEGGDPRCRNKCPNT